MAYRYCPMHAVLSTEDICWVGGCAMLEHHCWHVPCNGAQGHPSHTAASWTAVAAGLGD